MTFFDNSESPRIKIFHEESYDQCLLWIYRYTVYFDFMYSILLFVVAFITNYPANRSSERSCTRAMIHDKIHPISPGCLRRSVSASAESCPTTPCMSLLNVIYLMSVTGIFTYHEHCACKDELCLSHLKVLVLCTLSRNIVHSRNQRWRTTLIPVDLSKLSNFQR